MRTPSSGSDRVPGAWIDQPVETFWPRSLGSPPDEPAYAWIEPSDACVPWLITRTIAAEVRRAGDLPLAGPDPEVVARVHDKAFVIRAAEDLGGMPESLAPLISLIEPEALASPDSLLASLAARLERWPDWTGKRFTLKPRFGSTGRGRVGGVGVVDTPAIRRALGRLAARGGAVFEPWLDRRHDLSVSLWIPVPRATTELPTLLGSLEMLTTPSGGYRGHCGEIDSRGRIFSGHPEDEALRGHAAALGARARAEGYFGPCGVDAFVYREGEALRLRPAVELNARPTMGLIAMGVLRRVVPGLRSDLGLEPGKRCAFLLGLLPADASGAARGIAERAGARVAPLDLTSLPESGSPRPVLFFAPDLNALREAYRVQIGR